MSGTFCPMTERGDHKFDNEPENVYSRCRNCGHRILNLFRGSDEEKKKEEKQKHFN